MGFLSRNEMFCERAYFRRGFFNIRGILRNGIAIGGSMEMKKKYGGNFYAR